MAAIPPKVELCGIKQQADDLIEAAFKRGVKYGRYLEQQENGRIKEEHAALMADLKANIRNIDDGCELCAHHIECKGKDCPKYVEGVGAKDAKTGQEYPYLRWSCQDWEWGTCAMCAGTPCVGCDFDNNWKWRGMEGKCEKD